MEARSVIRKNRWRWVFLMGCSLVGILFLSSCMSWQTTAKQTLMGIFEATNSVSSIAETRFHERCMAQAKACNLNSDDTCKTLQACHSDREKFADIVKRIRESVAVGLMGIQLAQAQDVEAVIGKAMALLMQIKEIIGGDDAL